MTTTHPARQPSTERWLDDLGAAWTFDPDLPLARVDLTASLANQVRHVPLVAEVVDRYAADMARGDQFPPVLVAAEGEKVALLGGNHRHAAKSQIGHSTEPAYIIEADPAVLLRIRVEDNRRHGLPTSEAERVDHAVALMATGMSQGEAAAVVGIPQPKLSIAVAVQGADARASRLEVDDAYRRLPRMTRYHLSQLDEDELFAAAANEVAKAGVPALDVANVVRACRSVEAHEALRIIGQESVDWAERARDRAGNVRAVRSPRGRLDAALAEIRGLSPREVVQSCPNDDVRAVLAQRILDTAAVLSATHKALTGG